MAMVNPGKPVGAWDVLRMIFSKESKWIFEVLTEVRYLADDWSKSTALSSEMQRISSARIQSV